MGLKYKLKFRYSGDYTDAALGHLQVKSGQNNNGYVPYVDYARDYSPPPSQLQSQRNYNCNTTSSSNSYSTHLSLTTSNNALTSQSPHQQLNGQLPGGNLSLTRNRPELRQDNGLPSIQNSMNSIPNVLLGEQNNFLQLLQFDFLQHFLLHGYQDYQGNENEDDEDYYWQHYHAQQV